MMESQRTDMDVDMYDVIFKTIYLFLETNEFHKTADSFLSEIKVKFDRSVDKNSTNAKTLILRPYFETSDEFDNTSNGTQLTEFTSDELSNQKHLIPFYNVNSENADQNLKKYKRSKVQIDVLSAPKILSDTFTRWTVSADIDNFKFNNSPSVSTEMDYVKINKISCPDCISISRLHNEMLRLSMNSKNSDEMKVLHEMFKILEHLQDNHYKLIHLTHELKSAITTFPHKSRDLFLTKYSQELYEIYSYPGTHCSLDLPFVFPNGCQVNPQLRDDNVDDKTEYQVESSLIYSSIDSNKVPDLYIPLESKPVVDDIPGLIERPVVVLTKFDNKNNLHTSSCSQSNSTVTSNDICDLLNEPPVFQPSKMLASSMSVLKDDLSNKDDVKRSACRFRSEFTLKPPFTEPEPPVYNNRMIATTPMPAVSVIKCIKHKRKSCVPPYSLKQTNLAKTACTNNTKQKQKLFDGDVKPTNCNGNARIIPKISPRVSPSRGRRDNGDLERKLFNRPVAKSQSPCTNPHGLNPRPKSTSPINRTKTKQKPLLQTKSEKCLPLNYKKNIKDKTKLILERQKFKLESEQLLTSVQKPKKVNGNASKVTKKVCSSDRAGYRDPSREHLRENINTIKHNVPNGTKQKSNVQPRVGRKNLNSQRIEKKQQRIDDADVSKKRQQENQKMLKRIERMKMAPLTATLNVPTPAKQEFVVNCCYKMDYGKTISALSEEFLPDTKPNLNICDFIAPETEEDQQASCNDIHNFIGNYFDASVPLNEAKSMQSSESFKSPVATKLTESSKLIYSNNNMEVRGVTTKLPYHIYDKNSDSMPSLSQALKTCVNCQHSCPIFQVKKNGIKIRGSFDCLEHPNPDYSESLLQRGDDFCKANI